MNETNTPFRHRTDREVGGMETAHEGMVLSLDWHPLGHILASGSNDHTAKFWTRNRPGWFTPRTRIIVGQWPCDYTIQDIVNLRLIALYLYII